MTQKILLIECSDQPGLIATITQACFEHGFNIVKNSEFVDPLSKMFFMRSVLDSGAQADETSLLNILNQQLPKNAECRLLEKNRKRLVILATREAHCLGELLMKNFYGALEAEILAVVSNHGVLRPLVEKFDIPFHEISHEGQSRESHDQKMLDVIEAYPVDYLVLAKYMRVLSSDFVQHYPKKIINIHHSFLPAFVGAKPYHQAFERGVKIIGATAHFVNDELDQGPIICQDVIHVDHSYQAEKLAKAGQQLEESVLLNALQLVTREKVIVFGNRTVVFD